MSIEHFLLYRRRYEVAFALGVGVLWHVPAAVVFCLGHVALFSLFRYWGMPLGGLRYSIDDPLWFELLYEFRKDVITYSFIVLGLSAYQFICTRLQGEASFVGEQSLAARFVILTSVTTNRCQLAQPICLN